MLVFGGVFFLIAGKMGKMVDLIATKMLKPTRPRINLPPPKFNISTLKNGGTGRQAHQTFQVPKMEVLTYISCMDTASVRESPPPKRALQGTVPPF